MLQFQGLSRIMSKETPSYKTFASICCIKPLYTNEFFHLVGHNEPRMANCTYHGVTCWNFQIQLIQSLKTVLNFILANSLLFDLILYVPVNNFSVMSGRIFLG